MCLLSVQEPVGETKRGHGGLGPFQSIVPGRATMDENKGATEAKRRLNLVGLRLIVSPWHPTVDTTKKSSLFVGGSPDSAEWLAIEEASFVIHVCSVCMKDRTVFWLLCLATELLVEYDGFLKKKHNYEKSQELSLGSRSAHQPRPVSCPRVCHIG